MEIVIFWILFAFIVGMIGSGKTLGFWGAFLFSLLLSPIIGLIITLLYPSRRHREEVLAEHRKQTAILQSVTTPQPSLADEIKKLKKLHDSGVISSEEFESQKKRLLA